MGVVVNSRTAGVETHMVTVHRGELFLSARQCIREFQHEFMTLSYDNSVAASKYCVGLEVCQTSRHDNMGIMKRVAVLALVAAAAAHAAVSPQMTLKVGVDLVNVLFTVSDRKGNLVSGLARNDFLIEEDGK